LVEAHPDGLVAHAEDDLQFLERGFRVVQHGGAQPLRIQLAPPAPTGLRGQRAAVRRCQVTIDGTPRDREAARRFRFGATRLDEFYNPFTKIKCIGFHALRLA